MGPEAVPWRQGLGGQQRLRGSPGPGDGTRRHQAEPGPGATFNAKRSSGGSCRGREGGNAACASRQHPPALPAATMAPLHLPALRPVRSHRQCRDGGRSAAADGRALRWCHRPAPPAVVWRPCPALLALGRVTLAPLQAPLPLRCLALGNGGEPSAHGAWRWPGGSRRMVRPPWGTSGSPGLQHGVQGTCR